MKSYLVTTHLNRLIEPIQMSGYTTWFHGELRKLSEIFDDEKSVQQAKGKSILKAPSHQDLCCL